MGTNERQIKEIENDPDVQRLRSQENRDGGDSESDACSFETANDVADAAAATEIDEMEIEEEEGENMRHLRDVFEVDSGGESDDELSETSETSETPIDKPKTLEEDDALLTGLSDPKEWRWELSLEERWDASQALMETLRVTLSNAAVAIKISLSAAR